MTKEVWVAPRADGFAGNGTPGDPLNGSDFDALAQSFGPGMTIHLGPGIYTTLTGWTIPERCTVRGAGKFNTTIENSAARVTGNQVLTNSCFEDGGITITDLSTDGKFLEISQNIPLTNRKIDCIVLHGDNNLVERVHVTGWGGTWESELESYGILLSSRKTIGGVFFPTIGSKVRDCTANGNGGNYDNGISAAPLGCDALIESCIVRDVRPKGGIGHGAGLGANGAATFRNCSTHGCWWGFYSEYANGILLDGDRFLDCHERGLRFWIGAKDVTIARTLIEMRDDQPGAIAIEMDEKDGQPVTGLKIDGNTFRLKSGNTRFPVHGIKLPVAAGRGEHVTNNTLDVRINQNQLAKDAVCLGNRTLSGAVIASLMDRKGKWGK